MEFDVLETPAFFIIEEKLDIPEGEESATFMKIVTIQPRHVLGNKYNAVSCMTGKLYFVSPFTKVSRFSMKKERRDPNGPIRLPEGDGIIEY